MFGKKKKTQAEQEHPLPLPEVVTVEVASDDFLNPASAYGGESDDKTSEPEAEATEKSESVEETAKSVPIAEEDADAAMMAAFEAWLDDSMDDELSREAAKAAMTSVRKSIKAGRFDEALFDVIAKGSDYDRAIEEAGQEGEIRGRNARIEELMNDSGRDDGVPHPGANGGEQRRGGGYSIFDLARL